MSKKIHVCLVLLVLLILSVWAHGADKFTTIYSSRVMSQSLGWIAQEAGLFKNTISSTTWSSSHRQPLSRQPYSAAIPI